MVMVVDETSVVVCGPRLVWCGISYGLGLPALTVPHTQILFIYTLSLSTRAGKEVECHLIDYSFCFV